MSRKPEQTGSSGGRWDHLLKEIPNKAPVKKTEVPKPAPPVTIEEPVKSKEKILSVSEINNAVKRQLEGNFSHIWIQGEISNFKAHTSGHHYFSLKDDKAQISAVMFRGFNSKLKFRPESGMEVLVRGRITVYEPRGNYQVFCEHMEPVGTGALQKAFEQLKAKLQSEGLFDQKNKKPIPTHPQKIGVVTSPTGAAIQDILNVLKRRCRRAEVVVIPARVQGQTAAAEVVKGIELAEKVGGFDVLIVGRGGGSIEDLWCFNEEVVARAIAKTKIPTISAVGHEIDFTIADFVADLRAPTPSAAAEVVAQSEEELVQKLKILSKSLRVLSYQAITDKRLQLKMMQKQLVDPRKYLQDCMLRCDDWSQRLIQTMLRNLKTRRMQVGLKASQIPQPTALVENHKVKLKSLMAMLLLKTQAKIEKDRSQWIKNSSLLDSLSPLRVVDRGYAIVKDSKEKLISSVAGIKKKDQIYVEMKDGKVLTEVTEIKKKGRS